MAEAHKQLLVDFFFCVLINRGKRVKGHLQWVLHVREEQQVEGGATVRSKDRRQKKVRKKIQQRGGG